MIQLIRNCSHGSEISIYLVEGIHGSKKIIKTANTSNGIENLKREVNGWQWYQKKTGINGEKKLCKIIQENDKFLKIEIDYIRGKKPNYTRGLKPNSKVVYKVISHYCDVWSVNDNVRAPIHGDLSMDNIVLNEKGIHIIDWEHFDCEGGFWAWDALYFLFETLWFGMKSRNLPDQKEFDIIIRNIEILNDKNKISEQILRSPLKSVIKFIKNNYHKWGSQYLNYPEKFPVLNFSKEQVVLIDKVIAEGLF